MWGLGESTNSAEKTRYLYAFKKKVGRGWNDDLIPHRKINAKQISKTNIRVKQEKYWKKTKGKFYGTRLIMIP